MWSKRYVKVIVMFLITIGIITELSCYGASAMAEINDVFSEEEVKIEKIIETVPEETNPKPTEVVSQMFVLEATIPKEENVLNEMAEVEAEDETEEIFETVPEEVVYRSYASILSEAQASATKSTKEDDPNAISFVEEYEDGTRIYEFNNRLYTIPANLLKRNAMVSEDGYVERVTEVPHYLQQSYPHTKYGGHGTISSHGCGITCCAMVYSYLLDYEIRPDELAEIYGSYNTKVGSSYTLFPDSAEDFNLEVTTSYSWKEVEEALRNGCVVIANVQSNTIFTQGGHYIVYYGISEDGKIFINDPNIYNYGEWSHKALKEGFKDGFDPKYCNYSFPCWIYSPKDINALT